MDVPRLRVMDVRTEMLVFFQDLEGLTEIFAPGRLPGYPRGRLRDIRPQNLLFGGAGVWGRLQTLKTPLLTNYPEDPKLTN